MSLLRRWCGIVIDFEGDAGSLGMLWRLEVVVLPLVILPVFVPLGIVTWLGWLN